MSVTMCEHGRMWGSCCEAPAFASPPPAATASAPGVVPGSWLEKAVRESPAYVAALPPFLRPTPPEERVSIDESMRRLVEHLRAEVSRLTAERDEARREAEQREDALGVVSGEVDDLTEQLRDSQAALREAAKLVDMLCNKDGSPVDGFRFREVILALRALASVEGATD